MKPLVIVLPVSRKDFHLACKWLEWEHAINPTRTNDLIIWMSDDLNPVHMPIRGELCVRFHARKSDQAYEVAANSMFLGALDWVAENHPRHAMLWCEADTVPMFRYWDELIQAEYDDYGKPFMGDFHSPADIPHMTGNGIYPPNWRELAPSLAKINDDRPHMGWDSKCAHEIVPRSHKACTIQQHFFAPSVDEAWMKNIHPETALFHRCKDGSLIDVLCDRLGFPRIPLGPILT